MKNWQVGDTAWTAVFTPFRETTVTCPVCYGNRVVHLTLGNGTVIELPCQYCSFGYDPPTGSITERIPVAMAEQKTISQVTSVSDAFKTTNEYLSGHYRFRKEDLFESEAEATAEAEKRAEAYREELDTRAYYTKHQQAKSYSWNAGYHIREAKKNRASAERHERLAKICKERSRE